MLGQHLSHSDPRLDAIRLKSVLFTALIATGFALFPFLPDRLGASVEITLRTSAGAFTLCWVGFFVAETQRYRALQKAGIDFFSSLSVLNAALYLFAVLGLSAVALGFLPTLGRGVYIFGLFVLLFVSATSFTRVFLSLLRTER